MDSTQMIFPSLSLPLPVDDLGAVSISCKHVAGQPVSEIASLSQDKRRQVAKDFESVLLNKLLDGMSNTIGQWGFEQDGTSKQIQSIFWLYLARDIANNGGFGLWKDIHRFIINAEQQNSTEQSLGESV